MKEISMLNAEKHFPTVLAEVIEQGQEFIVKKHGEKVARIIPYLAEEEHDVDAVFNAMDKLASEVKSNGITAEEIRKMRDEGRDEGRK